MRIPDDLTEWLAARLRGHMDPAEREMLMEYVVSLLRHARATDPSQVQADLSQELSDFLEEETAAFVSDLVRVLIDRKVLASPENSRSFPDGNPAGSSAASAPAPAPSPSPALTPALDPAPASSSISALSPAPTLASAAAPAIASAPAPAPAPAPSASASSLASSSASASGPDLLNAEADISMEQATVSSSISPEITRGTPTMSGPQQNHKPERRPPQRGARLPNGGEGTKSDTRSSSKHALSQPNAFCRDFHLRGYCARGEDCRFSHAPRPPPQKRDRQELRPSAPPGSDLASRRNDRDRSLSPQRHSPHNLPARPDRSDHRLRASRDQYMPTPPPQPGRPESSVPGGIRIGNTFSAYPPNPLQARMGPQMIPWAGMNQWNGPSQTSHAGPNFAPGYSPASGSFSPLFGPAFGPGFSQGFHPNLGSGARQDLQPRRSVHHQDRPAHEGKRQKSFPSAQPFNLSAYDVAASIVVENVPEHCLNNVTIQETFSSYGPVEAIELDQPSRRALVVFSSPGGLDAAQSAHEDPRGFFESRFVRVYYADGRDRMATNRDQKPIQSRGPRGRARGGHMGPSPPHPPSSPYALFDAQSQQMPFQQFYQPQPYEQAHLQRLPSHTQGSDTQNYSPLPPRPRMQDHSTASWTNRSVDQSNQHQFSRPNPISPSAAQAQAQATLATAIMEAKTHTAKLEGLIGEQKRLMSTISELSPEEKRNTMTRLRELVQAIPAATEAAKKAQQAAVTARENQPSMLSRPASGAGHSADYRQKERERLDAELDAMMSQQS